MSVIIDPKNVKVTIVKSPKVTGIKLISKLLGVAGNGFPIMNFNTTGIWLDAVATVSIKDTRQLQNSKLELGFVNIITESVDNSYYEANDPADGGLITSWTKNKFWPCYDSPPNKGKGNWYNADKNGLLANATVNKDKKAVIKASFWDKPAGGVNMVEIRKKAGMEVNYRLVENVTRVKFTCILCYLTEPGARYIPLHVVKWDFGYRVRPDWIKSKPWRNKNAWKLNKTIVGGITSSMPVNNGVFKPDEIYNMVTTNSGKNRTPCALLQDQKNKRASRTFLKKVIKRKKVFTL